MRLLATYAFFGAAVAACSLVGLDDLVTEPCVSGAGRSIESIRAGNALCAGIESMRPAAEGTTWVCREPIGEDLFCVESSVDNDNDGVGAVSEGGLDCDDADPEVFGGQEETACDGKDNDCDGIIDENLIGAQSADRVYDEAVSSGTFAAGTERLSFIGGIPSTQQAVVVLDNSDFLVNQAPTEAFAAAPIGNDAIVLSKPLGVPPFQLVRTNGPASPEDPTPTANLADEVIRFPAIGIGTDSFLAAWFDESGTCGAPASSFRHTSGRSATGIDSALALDLPDASPVHPPVIIPVTGSTFLVFAANGAAIDAHLITAMAMGSTVESSVSFAFDDTVSAFDVAVGESDGDSLTLGLSVVVGCGSRALLFRELLHDLTTGNTSLGELALTDEGDDPPGEPSVRWSASAPRGFVVTWVTGDARRTFLARLIDEDGFATPAFDLGAAVPGALSFPYGAALGPAAGGGLRVWTYATGPSEGVYEIVLGCNMD